MLNPYEDMADQEFDWALEKKLDKANGKELLAIEGVYEAVSEHYNNAILDEWLAAQTKEEA